MHTHCGRHVRQRPGGFPRLLHDFKNPSWDRCQEPSEKTHLAEPFQGEGARGAGVRRQKPGWEEMGGAAVPGLTIPLQGCLATTLHPHRNRSEP